jgi:hypothetical protein
MEPAHAQNGTRTCRAKRNHKPAVLEISTHGPANTNFSSLLGIHPPKPALSARTLAFD